MSRFEDVVVVRLKLTGQMEQTRYDELRQALAGFERYGLVVEVQPQDASIHLSRRHYRTLAAIREGINTARGLAEKLGITTRSASVQVSQLSLMGLVERVELVRSADSERLVAVYGLTTAGREMLEAYGRGDEQ